MTDLIDACKNGDIDKVKELLEDKNTDINFQDDNGKTALLCAFSRGYIRIVKILLKSGGETSIPGKCIDLNLQDIYGSTILILSSLYGDTKMVKLILNCKKHLSVNLNIRDIDGYNAQSYAIRFNRPEILNLLSYYISFRENIEKFIPSYNILLSILIRNKCTSTLPNEIILLIKEYGLYVCGRELFR